MIKDFRDSILVMLPFLRQQFEICFLIITLTFLCYYFPNIFGEFLTKALSELSAPNLSILLIGLSVLTFSFSWMKLEILGIKKNKDIRSVLIDSDLNFNLSYNLAISGIQIPLYSLAYLVGLLIVIVIEFLRGQVKPDEIRMVGVASILIIFFIYLLLNLLFLPAAILSAKKENLLSSPLFNRCSPHFRVAVLVIFSVSIFLTFLFTPI